MEWGGKAEDFNLLFTFWAKWSVDCSDTCTSIPTWASAFALFIQHGGHQAQFITQCLQVPSVVFKFRTLTRHLFEICADPACLDATGWKFNEFARWSRLLPPDHAFPAFLRLPETWHLDKTVEALILAQMKVHSDQINRSFHYVIDPLTFVDAVTQWIANKTSCAKMISLTHGRSQG